MTSPAADGGRPRRAWIAFLLNLIVPPTGYAYLGAWRLLIVLSVGFIAAALAALQWTRLHPPGIYAFGQDGIAVAQVVTAVAAASHAAWLARRAPARHGASRLLLYIVPWTLLLIVSLVLRTYDPHPTYAVSSASMEPTLRAGDIVIADSPRAACGRSDARPGDVVVHHRPDNPQPYLARVVAGPGQTVEMRDGALRVDGVPAGRRPLGSTLAAGGGRVTEFEEILAGGRPHRLRDLGPDGALDTFGPVKVPAGAWFVLGDNRDNAADSRVLGPIPAADICAVATTIVYSKDPRRVGRRP